MGYRTNAFHQGSSLEKSVILTMIVKHLFAGVVVAHREMRVIHATMIAIVPVTTVTIAFVLVTMLQHLHWSRSVQGMIRTWVCKVRIKSTFQRRVCILSNLLNFVVVQQVKPYFLMQVGLELNFGSVLKVTFEGEFGMAQANSCGVDDKGYGNFLEGLHSSDFDSNQIATAMNLDSSCDVQRQLFGRLEATITLKLPVLPTLSLSATMAASFDFVQEKGNRKLRFQFSATLNSNIASFVKELSEQSVPIIGKWLGPTIYQGWSESELQLTKSLAMVQFMYANDVQYGTSFRFVGTFRIPNFCPSWLGTLRDTIQAISGLDPGLACSMKRLLDTVMRFCSGVDMKMKISTNDGRLDLSHTSLSVNQKTVTLQDLNDYLNFWDLNNGSNCLADGQCLSGRCAKEFKCRDKLDKGWACWKDDDCKSNRCQMWLGPLSTCE